MQNEDVIQHASSEEISDWYELLYFETYEYIRSIKMIWRKKEPKTWPESKRMSMPNSRQ